MNEVVQHKRIFQSDESSSHQSKKYFWLGILLFNALFFLLLGYFLPLKYEENDDIIMLLFASGVYSGVSDAHLVFINYIYGLGLVGLYKWWPSIEWYTYLFLLFHFISLSVLSFYLLKKPKNWLNISFLLLFYILEVHHLLFLQFTTTAGMLALGGIIFIRSSNNGQMIGGILLFNLGALIRFEAAMVVLLISLPAFFYQKDSYRKSYLPKFWYSLLIAVFLSLGCKYLDYQVYQSQADWRYYYAYNQLRGKINDNPNAKQMAFNLPSEISASDYQLLLDFFQDSKVINLDKLKIIKTALDNVALTQKLKNVAIGLWAYKVPLGIIVLLTFSLIFYLKSRPNQLIILGSFFIFFMVCSWVLLDATLKERVFIVALLAFLYVLVENTQELENNIFSYLPFLSLLSLYFLYKDQQVYHFNVQRIADFQEEQQLIKTYLAQSANKIIPLSGEYSLENQSIFQISKSYFRQRVYLTGWLSAIPYNKGYFESYQAFLQGVSLLLLKENKAKTIPLLIESMNQNYKIKVKPKIVLESTSFLIIEFELLK
jgi:hypothetical protein